MKLTILTAEEAFGIAKDAAKITLEEFYTQHQLTTTTEKAYEKTVTSKQLAKHLNLHEVTIRKKAAAGELPGMRSGLNWVFKISEVEEFLKSKKK